MKVDTKQKDTRGRIIDSAEAVFAENGYGGARVKEIAARVGVTSAMIHYYFQTKEDLYRAVLDRMIEDLVSLVGQIAPEPIEPVTKLKLFFFGLFDYASRHPNFSRLTNMETGHEDQDHIMGLVKKYFHPLYLDAVIFLESGMEQGVFRRIDPDHLIITIYGMIIPYFSDSLFLDVLMGERLSHEDKIRRRRDFLMDMILHILLKHPETQ